MIAITIIAGRNASARENVEIVDSDSLIYLPFLCRAVGTSLVGALLAARQSQRKRSSYNLIVGGNRFEIDAKRTQLTIQMCALHADSLGQLPDLAVTQYELLLQVGTLEFFARFA